MLVFKLFSISLFLCTLQMFSKYYIINWNFYFNLKPITKAKGITIKRLCTFCAIQNYIGELEELVHVYNSLSIK